MPKITQLSWNLYLRPPTTFLLLEKTPKVQEERCSEQVAAQRGLNAAEGHTAGRQSRGRGLAHERCPTRTVSQGCGVGGDCRPLISRQPEWPAPAAVPMERIAAHKRPDAFLGWRKGLCYLARGRRESRLALGILTAQPPNKTRAHGPLPLAR